MAYALRARMEQLDALAGTAQGTTPVPAGWGACTPSCARDFAGSTIIVDTLFELMISIAEEGRRC